MSDPPEDVGTKIGAATSAASIRLLDPKETQALRGIRVFDVGQGDCIGLLDQARRVFCYVDYGGVIGHPDKKGSGYTPTRLPVNYGKGLATIVLTHWDKDHFYSAYQRNTAAQKCEWIVPRQWAAPFSVRFAAKLKNAKCWPRSQGLAPQQFPVGSTHFIEIQRCAPFDGSDPLQDRNHSGLAITLIERASRTAAVRVMLLPGDCPFHKIPAPPVDPIRAFVAFHHGAKKGWATASGNVVRKSVLNVEFVYSFSPQNTYQHPERSNYQKILRATAEETPTLRLNKKEYVDILW